MRVVAIVALSCGLGFVGTASAGGGQIAGAPQLPVGQFTQASTNSAPDFWALTLAAGDVAVLDFGKVADEEGVCVWPPDVTDYTDSSTECSYSASTAGTTGKQELQFRADVPGNWTVMFFDTSECNFGTPVNNCPYSFTYQVTAYVHHFTSIVLQAPTHSRSNASTIVRGRVNGASSGSVQIRWQSGRTKRLISTPLSSGAFVASLKFPHRGTYAVRAVYRGDASHLASASFARKIHVK